MMNRSLMLLLLVGVVTVSGCAIRQGPLENSTIFTNISLELEYSDYVNPNARNYTTMTLPDPLVRSPMPYYVYNTSELNAYKHNLTLVNIRKAFDTWENATQYRVRFYEVSEKPREGIIIELVPELYNNTIGEASPTYYDRGSYSLIIGGQMTVKTLYGGSENRVLIQHEIGHIMGFGHSSDSHSVMFPYNAYSQVITDDMISTLNSLYRNVPVDK